MRKAGIARGWSCALAHAKGEKIRMGEIEELSEDELHGLDIGVRCGVAAILDILEARFNGSVA